MVNALRGLPNNSTGAAPVNEDEEKSINKYQYDHPRYKNIVLWDIPGLTLFSSLLLSLTSLSPFFSPLLPSSPP
jgi:hypothetical protein